MLSTMHTTSLRYLTNILAPCYLILLTIFSTILPKFIYSKLPYASGFDDDNYDNGEDYRSYSRNNDDHQELNDDHHSNSFSSTLHNRKNPKKNPPPPQNLPPLEDLNPSPTPSPKISPQPSPEQRSRLDSDGDLYTWSDTFGVVDRDVLKVWESKDEEEMKEEGNKKSVLPPVRVKKVINI